MDFFGFRPRVEVFERVFYFRRDDAELQQFAFGRRDVQILAQGFEQRGLVFLQHLPERVIVLPPAEVGAVERAPGARFLYQISISGHDGFPRP